MSKSIMKKQQVNDQMALISQYYPDIYTQLVPDQEQGEVKPRRRRKKNKGSESGGSGSTGGMMRKRKLSDEQVHLLEMNFGSEHKLESERKDRLASELGLDPRQVAVWFQNRRARWKNKKLEEEYAKLKAQHDNTVVEKCRLETEVLKLKEQLSEAEREMHRAMERSEGISISNSPSSSFSMEAMEPLFLGEFGMEGLETVFNSNFTNHGLEWPVNQQYGINGM